MTLIERSIKVPTPPRSHVARTGRLRGGSGGCKARRDALLRHCGTCAHEHKTSRWKQVLINSTIIISMRASVREGMGVSARERGMRE